MDPGLITGIVSIVVFLILIFVGIPIAAAMAICGIVGSYFFLHDWNACFTIFSQRLRTPLQAITPRSSPCLC